jgi:hypothetical protein
MRSESGKRRRKVLLPGVEMLLRVPTAMKTATMVTARQALLA